MRMNPVPYRGVVLLLLASLPTLAIAEAPARGSNEYRDEVTRLQVGFPVTTEVLREDQVEAMIRILRDADRKPRRDPYIREQARKVLTPAQYAALDARMRRQSGHDELLRIARHVMATAPSRMPPQIPGRPGPFLVGVNDDVLIQDAEYRRAWLEQARREVESTYVDVPQILQLSPALAAQLFSLLVGQQLARLENPRPRTAHAWREILRQEERELAALLGEHGATRFLEFRDTYGHRFRAKHLRVEIGAGRDALRQDQVEALITVLRDADALPRAERHARIHQAAAAFLPPAQLAALDDWLERFPG